MDDNVTCVGASLRYSDFIGRQFFSFSTCLKTTKLDFYHSVVKNNVSCGENRTELIWSYFSPGGHSMETTVPMHENGFQPPPPLIGAGLILELPPKRRLSNQKCTPKTKSYN